MAMAWLAPGILHSELPGKVSAAAEMNASPRAARAHRPGWQVRVAGSKMCRGTASPDWGFYD